MIGPKTYGCRVQRDEHEIDDSEFMKVKKSKKVHILRVLIHFIAHIKCFQDKDVPSFIDELKEI